MEDIINVIVYGTPYGVPGATGAIGPQGPGNTLTGPLGPTGPTGPQGTGGIQGDPGAKGNPGPQGDPGTPGLQGNTGPTGPRGNTGTDGTNGITGLNGVTGNTGPTGPKGNTGTDGTNGITGSTGNTGPTGPKGTTGTPGDLYSTTSGTNVNLSGLIVDSPVFLSVPSGLAYSVSQSVIAAASITQSFNGLVLNYNASGMTLSVTGVTGFGSASNWNVNLAGAAGQQGEIGPIGPVGPRGPTGSQGNTGVTGNQGNTGATGVTGADSTVPGPTGPTGPQGNTGNTGNDGNRGATGATGADSTVPGPTGPRGNTGNDGSPGTAGISGPYVITFNGLTGDVTGVTTGTANNFVALQTFSSGISASGGITFGNDILVNRNVRIGRGLGNISTNLSFGTNTLNGTGSNNIGIGNSALFFNETGTNNIAVGTNSLFNLQNSIKNIAIGTNALKDLTTGTGNIAVGYDALQNIMIGRNNIGLGINAGGLLEPTSQSNSSSLNSIYIGHNSKGKFTVGVSNSNEIVIGNDAIGLGSNSTTIGVTTQTAATIYGLLNVPSGISGYNQFTLNGLTGAVNIVASTNMGVSLSGNNILLSSSGSAGACGPIILDNTVYIRGVCGNSAILIDPSDDSINISGPRFTNIGTNGAFGPPTQEAYIQMDGLAGILTLRGSRGINFANPVTTITGELVTKFNGLTGNVEGVGSIGGGTGISVSGTSRIPIINNTGVVSVSQGAGILLTGSTLTPTITNIGVRQLSGTAFQTTVTPTTGTGSVIISLPSTIKDINNITSTDLTKGIGLSHDIILGEETITTNILLKSNVLSIGNSVRPVNTTAFGSITVTGSNDLTVGRTINVGSNLNVTGNYNGTVVRSFNGNTGAITGVSTVANLGPYISVSGPTGNVTIQNNGVRTVNGLTGFVVLAQGTNISLVPSGNTITINAEGGGGGSGDGSAIISKLYPRLPENGLCAGDLISYNGIDRWVPTPRTFLATPSMWQTIPDTANVYPSSRVTSDTININGTTGNGFVVGELVQISVAKGSGVGITFNSGTWWLNYTVYNSLLSPSGGDPAGVFKGCFSGLTIINTPSLFNPTIELDGDVHGFAVKIRGTTYNAYDGRGGPFGSTLCTQPPNTMPLGDNTVCDGEGVVGYPVVCETRDGEGFTYNGVFFDCLPI